LHGALVELAKLKSWRIAQDNRQLLVGQHDSAVRSTMIRQLLVEHFSLDEIRGLIFDLGIQPDTVPGEGLTAKALELVAYCERRGLLDVLIQSCQRQRPLAPWPTL
jgi:hypothetical protein